MKFIKIFLAVFVITALSISCSKKGSEFFGKWRHVTNHSAKLEIIKNGDNYLVIINGKETPAIYNNGNLEIKTNQLGMETITISYIEKDDKIIVNGFNGPQELVRDNEPERTPDQGY